MCLLPSSGGITNVRVFVENAKLRPGDSIVLRDAGFFLTFARKQIIGIDIIFSIFAIGIAMSSKEKLVKRFLSLPRDFTFDEVVRLFALFGFVLSNKGHSSGSRVAFIHSDEVFTMHRPHPENIVKRGTLQNIKEYLENKNLI